MKSWSWIDKGGSVSNLWPEALDLGDNLDGHGIKQLSRGVMLQGGKRPQRVCQLLGLEALDGEDRLSCSPHHQLRPWMVPQSSKCPEGIGDVLQITILMIAGPDEERAITYLW